MTEPRGRRGRKGADENPFCTHARAHARDRENRNHPPPSAPFRPPAERLHTLAARVAGLFLSFSDPEAFHVEKHAIASELRRLAREARP